MTVTLLVQIAAKATLVLMAGWGLTRLMAHTSAAARHLVWVLALVAALAVPLVHVAGPAWTLAVLPQLESAGQPSSAVITTAPAVEPIDLPERIMSSRTSDRSVRGESVAAARTDSGDGTQPAVPSKPVSWGAIVVRVWLAGVAFMLLRLVIGVAWAAFTVRRAADLPHTGWLDSLDDASIALGLTRRVGLKVSERAAVPMATGLWKAVVLLPLSAIDWPEERRRVVLQHELAHVRRRDCLLQAVAQCACAIHWFNPAAHLAVSSLRAEQERACDDIVLAVGTDARSYADHLFEIARSFRAASFPTWVAMSMARPSQLEGRMLAILDEARVRCAPSLAVRAALIIGTLVIAVPFGALRLAAQSTATVDGTSVQDAEATTESLAFQPAEAPSDDRGDRVDPSLSGASFDVVHGDLADVDLLVPSPGLRFGDAIQVGAFEGDSVLVSKVFKDATKNAKWLLAQPLSAAQGGTAVSDETRKRVADALLTALNDDNPQVRQEALSSLASMRDERAIPGLVRALNDPTVEVRMRALGALVQFDSAPAAEGVLAALKDRSPEVREQAARHLAALVSRGRLSDPKYVEAFSALLKDENAEVREQAASALGRLRTPAASGPLTQALRDNSPDVREQAARALGQLGNPDAVPALSGLLKDTSKDVREQAALALGNIADPRAIDALTAALKDAEPSVREQAARALGQIARGQRRGVRPGVPVPPVPPLPPRAFVDQDQIREMTQRAREAAEDARRDVERAMRDMDFRFDRFPVPAPAPVPEPAPAPPAPRR